MASFQLPRRALLALVLGLAAALAQATPSASEQKLIDTLILRVSKMTTMTFMRNGDEHNAADAAKHMQAKFDHFKDEITTAEDFIDRCASRSEMTGKPYKIKMPNGSMRDANEFLNAELRTLRQGGGSGKPGAG
ncbi:MULTISPECIES: DUF5329 family protein [Variovorax]|jgi:hypothetical protein|uniref:DUF5329 family protein n=1 Tax=Variovorax TaxID=34072 RepID=UPI001DE4BE04|nr:DUF5329 family protein [Variovorax paradoxus]MBW8716817.1 DUF5329 family protein [Variovorax paradoxus]